MFHEERLVLGVHDNNAWQIPSDVVDENPCGALRLAESPTEYWNTPANTRVADAERSSGEGPQRFQINCQFKIT
jgi:hypothetical protein